MAEGHWRACAIQMRGENRLRDFRQNLTNKKMKSILLMMFFSAAHIFIFLAVRKYTDINPEINFLMFWGCMALTWAATIKAVSRVI
jgi:hypothetical protein